eukprot:scaffold42868_cov57-Phaeocystis_antarctica.AAC.1
MELGLGWLSYSFLTYSLTHVLTCLLATYNLEHIPISPPHHRATLVFHLRTTLPPRLLTTLPSEQVADARATNTMLSAHLKATMF